MGTPVQFNGEVLILLGRIVSPIGLEALPETFSQGLLGPGKPCGLGVCPGYWRACTFLGLSICLLVPSNASVPGDPVDQDLAGRDGMAPGRTSRPGVCSD